MQSATTARKSLSIAACLLTVQPYYLLGVSAIEVAGGVQRKTCLQAPNCVEKMSSDTPVPTQPPPSAQQPAEAPPTLRTPESNTGAGRDGAGGRTGGGRGRSGGGGGRTGGGGRNYNNYQGRSGGGGGRTPMGGRALVSTDGAGGRGTPHQHRGTAPVSVHSSSGVPFGHVPAYLPGSSSLVEELDQRILIVLRDGKHLIGTLSSFDQFSNLVLLDAIERRIVTVKTNGANKNYYADIPLGMYIVRGDSLVLCGEVHNQWPLLEEVTLEELEKLQDQAEAPLEWEFDLDLTA